MKKEKCLSNIIFAITLISPMLAFVLMCEIGEADIFGIGGIIKYSWIMWLFIPIGVLSILIGLKLKKSGQKYKKNFVIALICLPLLIILGSYRFIFNTLSYDINKVNLIENEIKLELPDQIKIVTHKMYSYDVSYLKIINDEDKAEFEQELETNQLWQNRLSSKIKSLLPFDIQLEAEAFFDYFLLYNVTLDEYNNYPLNGEYTCIFVAYDCELQRLIILDDYKINLN